MSLTLTTAPTSEPITLTEAKAWLRVDHTDEDTLITDLIKSVRDFIETTTRRAFINQTWTLTLDGFPCDGVIELPRYPLSSVTSILYLDANGATQTLSGSAYQVDIKSMPGRVIPAAGTQWPIPDPLRINNVSVVYVAGYGSADTAVPYQIKQAVKFVLAHWYESRSPVNAGSISELPLSVRMILSQLTVPLVSV